MKFKLRPYQQEIIDSTYSKFLNGKKRVLVTAPTGAGKEQWVGAKVSTPFGWSKIGDLRIGELITNTHGTTSEVTGVFPQGEKDVYEITFSDGSKTTCGLEHLWDVRTRSDLHEGRKFKTLTLKEILDRGYKKERVDERYGTTQVDLKFHIPGYEPVYYPVVPVTLDPYLVGALIGDGGLRSKSVVFSNSEGDVVEKVRGLLPKDDVLIKCTGNNVDYRVKGGTTLKLLREIGLNNVYSHEKFIPTEYLINSVSNRIKLLRGLIDTDGTFMARGSFEYSTTSPRLAEDVVTLVRSLGGRAKVALKSNPKYTYKGESLVGKDCYRVYLTFNSDIVPVSSSKHLLKFSSRACRALRCISDIRLIGKMETVCISTSADNQLYLTDDFIVTHNTIISQDIARRVLAKGNAILFTAHRRNLVEQTVEKFGALGPNISVMMGSDKRFDPTKLVQIGTLQTIKNRELEVQPKLIVIDEVHYGWNSRIIDNILDKYPNVPIIGLSATPIDERGYLLEGFDSIVDDIQTQDLIEMGYLVDTINYAPISPNLSAVKIMRGDYETAGLEKAVNKRTIVSDIVKKWKKLAENRKTITFCVNIAHAKVLSKAFTDAGIPSDCVYSGLKDSDRDEVYRKFREGEIKILCNVDILIAGFDQPDVSCVVLARPTKSLRTYIQMVGRGLRLHPDSGKENCILLDCGNVIEELGMPTERRTFEFKPKFSRKIDRQLGINTEVESRQDLELPPERVAYLKRVGKILDLYEGKVYLKEADLQEDVNKYLSKTKLMWYRQNSGKAYMDGRWVHFASIAGLPDCTVFTRLGSVYIGIELKLPKGYLSEKQKDTLPMMIHSGLNVFIAESVAEVHDIIEFVTKNVIEIENGFVVSNNIYNLPERQLYYRKKFKLPVFVPH